MRLLFFVLILTYSACRKVDKTSDLQAPTKTISVTEKFFTLPANTKTLVKAISQIIFRQNEKEKFVEELVKKIGYPKWEKAIWSKQYGAMQTESGNTHNNIIYLPFAIPDSISTAAVLVIGLSPIDTAFSLVYPQQYQQYGFDTTTNLSARNLFHLFAEFDHSIFGHTTFMITDGRIFGKDQEDTLKAIRTLSTFAGNNTESGEETCSVYHIIGPCPPVSTESHGTACLLTTFTICDYIFIPDYGSGGGGSGGGGGGVSWPNIPQCPTQPVQPISGIITNNVDPCNTGWVPLTLRQLLKLWDDKIIIDYTVRPCIENIIDQIKGLEEGTIARIIHNLSGNLPGFDWEIAEAPSPNSNDDALTTISPNSPVPHAMTHLNSTKLQNATNISLARTIIHESVHAFLYNYFYYASGLSQSERDNILGLPYSKMLKQYLRHSQPLQGNSEHNFMANTFRKDIAEALKMLCPVLGINLTGHELDLFCDDMSWGSLQDDDDGDSPWRELAPVDRARITKRLEIELNNLTGFSGTVYDRAPGSQLSFPVSLTRVGTKACP